MIILGFPDSRRQAQAVARELDVSYREVDMHRFPDGESKLTLPEVGPERVVLFRSLDRPNDKLVELLLAGRALRETSAQRLSLVAPYLCYMRQDWAFNPGEVVSQKIVGQLLADVFEDVITVDPHLHRISRLEEAVPAANPVTLSAAPLFAAHLRTVSRDTLIVGPDSESEQWVKAIAEASGLPFAVSVKQRFGDARVSVELPDVPVRGRHIVLVDDIASTGSTLADTAAKLLAQGAAHIDALVTHPVFVDGAVSSLCRCGIETIGSSDSIVHPTNVVFLAPLLAEALRKSN